MATKEERELCTAPQGKLRIIHKDPRDHWPTPQADCQSVAEVQQFLSGMMSAQQDVTIVYDDKGTRVEV